MIEISYNINSITEDCHPGTTVLVNKFNIRNQKNLDEIETLIVSLKTAEFDLNFDSSVELDFEFYKGIHKYLFEKIYEWAGVIRQIDLSKKRTNFCSCKYIEETGEAIFKRLRKMNYFSDLNFEEQIEELVDLYNNINYIHPFREGNGRTQRFFFESRAEKWDMK